MRQRRLEGKANDSCSSKVHRPEGYLAAAQIKPVIFTLLRCTSAELIFLAQQKIMLNFPVVLRLL
jgi:hypothetical protein